jgi:hypothetical protein
MIAFYKNRIWNRDRCFKGENKGQSLFKSDLREMIAVWNWDYRAIGV